MAVVCVSCREPLVIAVDHDESEADGQTEIIDDLTLPCQCRFHWQCLMDSAAEVALSLKCPSCESYLAASQPGPSTTNTVYWASQDVAILTRYHNEGGIQEDLNILPDLTEEAYLHSHPEARPARAMHTMSAEGDVEGILAVLSDAADPEEDGALRPDQLLRYQDPLDGMKSALHIAIEKDQLQVALLLLFLASGAPTDIFPADAIHAAEGYGLTRPTLSSPEQDIRGLKDEQGRTAEEYASHAAGRWTRLLEAGMFS